MMTGTNELLALTSRANVHQCPTAAFNKLLDSSLGHGGEGSSRDG